MCKSDENLKLPSTILLMTLITKFKDSPLSPKVKISKKAVSDERKKIYLGKLQYWIFEEANFI